MSFTSSSPPHKEHKHILVYLCFFYLSVGLSWEIVWPQQNEILDCIKDWGFPYKPSEHLKNFQGLLRGFSFFLFYWVFSFMCTTTCHRLLVLMGSTLQSWRARHFVLSYLFIPDSPIAMWHGIRKRIKISPDLSLEVWNKCRLLEWSELQLL